MWNVVKCKYCVIGDNADGLFLFTLGMVQYADIKMENGKSKGCGVVRFDSPETAERACRTMNGYRLNGREIDVRIDRNA